MEPSKLLSGRDLVESVSFKASDTALVKGTKQVIPNGSWIEKRQIESALDTYKSLLEQQRIEKHGSLSQAQWIHKLEKALVTERKGPHWLHIGHVEDQKTYIYPEEALHLMEMNSLELKYGGVTMSLQQAYVLLIGKSVSPDEYRVYSLLSKQGFKLFRYNVNRQYCSFENTNDSDYSGNEGLETKHSKDSVKTKKHQKVNGTDKTVPVFIVPEEKSNDVLPNKLLETKGRDNLVLIDTKDNNTCMEIPVKDSNIDDMSIFETSVFSEIVEQPSFNDSIQNLLEKQMNCIHGLNTSIDTDEKVLSPKSGQVNVGFTSELNCRIKFDSLNENTFSPNDSVKSVTSREKCKEVMFTGDENCRKKDLDLVTEKVIDIDSSEMSVAPSNNDSVDIINVDRFDLVTGNSNSDHIVESDSNHLHKNSEPGETVVINANVANLEINSMCVDSSSDDCMIVNESPKKTDNVAKIGQKRASEEKISNSCTKFFRKNNCDENCIGKILSNNSSNIDVDEFSVQAKLKILESIVNCHRKNTIYVEAPSKRFIPSDINLAQKSYSVDLNRLSSKNNFENVHQSISYTNQIPSNQFTNNTPTNFPYNSSHNPQYWNHIFHQVRMQSQNTNALKSNYPDGFGGHINLFNSRDPRTNPNPLPFSHLSHQFSNNQEENPDFDYGNVPSQSSRDMAWNQPSQIFFNDNIRNHVNKVNMQKQNRVIQRNATNKLNSLGTKSNDEEETLSQNNALKRIEKLLSTYNSLNERQKSEIKDSLKKTVDLYNKQYNTNFVSNLEMPELNNQPETNVFNSTKSVLGNQNEKVVQLSSGSDTDNRSQSTSRDDSNPRRGVKMVKKRRLELNQRRQRYSNLCFDVNNSDSSNESDVENAAVLPLSITNPRKAIYDSDQVHIRDNIPDKIVAVNTEDVEMKENSVQSNKNEFKSWVSANSWNKPEVSSKKEKNKRIAFTNINLSSAYLHNIKELSYNEKSVNSWQQAKRVYENENMSAVVCVSDDEILNDENTLDATAFNDEISFTDKILPLVRPEDCKTVDTVLKRLQIIKSTSEISDANNKSVSTELKISFDLYAPTFKKLKKTRLPSPNYSIIVLSHSSPLPAPSAFSKLRSNLPGNVPFLLAIVSFDAVSFIQMENVDLPILIRRNNTCNMKF